MSESSRNELIAYTPPQGVVNLSEVNNILIEQMKEVKNNPSAIPQAECMVGVAGRIAEIAKTQVLQMEAVNNLMRTKHGLS